MIKLYGNASPNVVKVVIMLEETGMPYEYVWIDQYQDEQFSPAYARINPNNKVPAIVDEGARGRSVFESGAILIYLAEKTGCFLPASEPDRSSTFAWLMLQMSGIGPMFGQFNHFNSPDYSNEDVPYAKNRFGNEARRIIKVLEHRLSECAYLAGSAYSIADIAAYPWMVLRSFIGLPAEGLPNIEAWTQRIAARPAVMRAQERWDKARAISAAAKAAASPEQRDRYFGRVPR